MTAKKTWFWLGSTAGQDTGTVLAVYHNISLSPSRPDHAKKGMSKRSPSTHSTTRTDNQSVRLGTSLEQSNLAKDGMVVWGSHGTAASTLVKPGTYNLDGNAWVLHNRILYSSLPTSAATGTDSVSLNLTFGPVSGAWSRISEAGSNATITSPIFSLDVVHNVLGSDYSYAITTNVSSAAQAATINAELAGIHAGLKTERGITVIAPTTDTLLATVWAPGAVATDDARNAREQRLALQVDTPCVLTASKSDKHVWFSVANPENTAANVSITVSGHTFVPTAANDATNGIKCASDGTVTVMLPDGALAGSTMSGNCQLAT
eukprot:SAG31_NODE_5039_length_2782_cov_1.722326_2_plen_319_part_00